uniref:Tick transposon n=1 Tax=Macrostomum lignano TaxID=282301 RepID=A0A1I8FM65_9PLAT
CSWLLPARTRVYGRRGKPPRATEAEASRPRANARRQAAAQHATELRSALSNGCVGLRFIPTLLRLMMCMFDVNQMARKGTIDSIQRISAACAALHHRLEKHFPALRSRHRLAAIDTKECQSPWLALVYDCQRDSASLLRRENCIDRARHSSIRDFIQACTLTAGFRLQYTTQRTATAGWTISYESLPVHRLFNICINK